MQQEIIMEPLMTSKEAENFLRVSRSTLIRLRLSGQIPGHKVGSRWRFYRSELKLVIRDVIPEQGVAS